MRHRVYIRDVIKLFIVLARKLDNKCVYGIPSADAEDFAVIFHLIDDLA